MGTYNVHAGHCPDGKGANGAVGLIKESTEARKIKDLVIKYLKNQGHTVYDCTCETKETQSGCLKKIVNKCNAHKVDLDISIHFNSGASDKAGNGKTTGSEVWIYPNSISKSKAQAIINEIAGLGLKNRGVKNSKNLYILKNTSSPAVLIEVCFVDDKDDVDLYKKNIDNIAKAIVKGITGKTVTSTNYIVQITADVLNVRKGPGTSYAIAATVKKNYKYTIVEVKNGWGKLKSGIGWINLSYTKKV